MMQRMMRVLGRLVIGYPAIAALCSLLLTVFFYLNIHRLRTDTELTELFGNRDPQWQAAADIGRELGYGNQLFIVIESKREDADNNEAMELAADRLTEQMKSSGLFRHERSGLSSEEMMNMVRLFSWNLPAYADDAQRQALTQALQTRQIHENVRHAAAELMNPFSTMGTDYFAADPLGVMRSAAGSAEGFSQYSTFDLSWGGGNRFYSRDHRALLLIAEPYQSAVDYKYAGRIMQWTHAQLDQLVKDPAFRDAAMQTTPAGAYVYAEQDHQIIESNIRRISTVSIVGSLALCLLVYPSIPLLLLSLLPTGLGILWTTGIAAFYPGEVNLISLSFIAILAGLGDDQVVHFFNRSPQEWNADGGFDAAMLRTYETTGQSIVLCILTAASATVALAFASFRALAEFGFILTVGMFMMMIHTLLSVPALMQLWNRYVSPFRPQGITFRFLPAIAQGSLNVVAKHARMVSGVALLLFLVSAALLPTVHVGGNFAVMGGEDSPAVRAQNLLSQRFGIEGNSTLLLVAGSEQEVLQRAENLTQSLDAYRDQGKIRSVFSPTQLLPSLRTQQQRAANLSNVDYSRVADDLADSLKENGLLIEPYQSYLDRLRGMRRDEAHLTLESASPLLPAGLLENSLRRTKNGTYVAAIAYYAAPGVTQPVSASELEGWRRHYGPFVEFSFDKINRDVQSMVLSDSRKALCWTALAILLLVFITFRNLRMTALVLMPIVFAIIVTFGILRIIGHSFSFMAITAIPLIIGIGIDNGIHLVRRYREREHGNILEVAQASGAALIQSNLTTMVGFGALLVSSFQPLAEMGLVTTLGVALTLVGGLWLIPAVLLATKSKSQT